jgi:iron(III) transport system substrate-binding protein
MRLGAACLAVLFLGLGLAAPAHAQPTLNAYSIWPESWAVPVFEEFTKATGIKVNFIRFSSGEALTRVRAEKDNPRVDVLFGGPADTHVAGAAAGLFEPYKPPEADRLPPRFKDPQHRWIGVADDPLVFMFNARFLKERNLPPPTSWQDLLHPAFKDQLQMADARTSGTAVTRIFSILEVNGRNEDRAFEYMRRLRPQVAVYTKSGGGGTLPVGTGNAAGGIFFIVDALKTKQEGYDVVISFPREGIGSSVEAVALIKGAKNPELGKKLIDWATSPAMQTLYAQKKINFVPAHPEVKTEPSLAALLKEAKIIAIDESWAGENRKRIVDRWVNEVLKP